MQAGVCERVGNEKCDELGSEQNAGVKDDDVERIKKTDSRGKHDLLIYPARIKLSTVTTKVSEAYSAVAVVSSSFSLGLRQNRRL
jgi:hypothetical protein